MLSSARKQPVLIDQPEDNLDSEFTYSTLVRICAEQRSAAKSLWSHNANIAVLSDAKQIVALKSTSDKASVIHRGSIDGPRTRDATCEILDGAFEAFKLMTKLCGFA